MFYLLHKRKLLPIDPDRIYTYCPRCGTLHAVDLQTVIETAGPDFDLCKTAVYCHDCSREEYIDFNGHTLHRIKAVRDFNCVKAGDLGGFIESEKNLDHDGDARVSDDAWVRELSDIALIEGFGREFRATIFFRCVDGLVRCQCGCFYGTVDEFRAKVRETHGNSKYAKEYLMIADLMELHFKED